LLALRGAVALGAAIPGAVVHLPAPSGVAIACYAGGLGAALGAWHFTGRRRGLLVGGAAGLLTLAVGVWSWPMLAPTSGRLRVTILDVGQGDAIVVEAPDGRAMVVDAGTGGPWRLDVGERVVAPFLWNRAILRLAATVVTHADADHAGGMAALHRLLPVRERWDAQTPRAFGGAWITPLGAVTDSARVNDHAIVLRVELGLASVLLASDIEAAAERALVGRGAPLAATVLKVAHHGAATSSTTPFLAAVRPAIAVISVGARNGYGHPHPGTLTRLHAAGAHVYRTDRDGAVLLETDGRTLTVTRWADQRVERLCLDPESIC
jgi:competence protein ComEC